MSKQIYKYDFVIFLYGQIILENVRGSERGLERGLERVREGWRGLLERVGEGCWRGLISYYCVPENERYCKPVSLLYT